MSLELETRSAKSLLPLLTTTAAITTGIILCIEIVCILNKTIGSEIFNYKLIHISFLLPNCLINKTIGLRKFSSC